MLFQIKVLRHIEKIHQHCIFNENKYSYSHEGANEGGVNKCFSKSNNNNSSKRILSLGLSKKGNPRHPLYMPNQSFLRKFDM